MVTTRDVTYMCTSVAAQLLHRIASGVLFITDTRYFSKRIAECVHGVDVDVPVVKKAFVVSNCSIATEMRHSVCYRSRALHKYI